jgi:hypothetical protein
MSRTPISGLKNLVQRPNIWFERGTDASIAKHIDHVHAGASDFEEHQSHNISGMILYECKHTDV